MEQGNIKVRPLLEGEPSLMRLCAYDDQQGSPAQEIVLTIQGFVTQCHLPPITHRKQYVDIVKTNINIMIVRRLPTKPLYSAQSIDIVGYGDPTFENGIDAISYISKIFEYSPDCKAPEPYCTRSWRSQPIISASNRYFTLQSSAPHEVLTSFPSKIDPINLLIRFAQTSTEPLVNLDENEVRYFVRSEDKHTGA